jgi:hypothetical protein
VLNAIDERHLQLAEHRGRAVRPRVALRLMIFSELRKVAAANVVSVKPRARFPCAEHRRRGPDRGRRKEDQP